MTRRFDIEAMEARRVELQAELDGQKTPGDRNQLGQFSTPTELAREVLAHGVRLMPKGENIRFVDPALGTGAFYSALRSVADAKRIDSAAGIEIDRHYGVPARELWKDTPLDIRIEDFTRSVRRGRKANLLICNPPYVRHHHIDAERKADIQCRVRAACGVNLSGLAGMYCHFMCLSDPWMADGGVAGWLVPSEFMDVNYGRSLKRYLLEKVTLLQVHRFDPSEVQFPDALVSSAVVWLRKAKPPSGHTVRFTYGGTLSKPAQEREIAVSTLASESKWTRFPKARSASRRAAVVLGDLFEIKRGLVTGSNDFFIMDREGISERGLPMECFAPVLPGSRHIPRDEIEADEDGLPLLEKRLYVLQTRLPESEIARRHPELSVYLRSGHSGESPVAERYVCRSRRPWYAQERRPAAPIVCTYMGRSRNGSRPFRFILNHSRATACNVFLLLYPKPIVVGQAKRNPETLRRAWEFMNGIDVDELLGHGRVYGGGLHKLEPRELRNVPADGLAADLDLPLSSEVQPDLLEWDMP